MTSYRKAKTIRCQLQEIIQQGNNHEILELFVEIVQAYRVEFTEDNEPTLAVFLIKNLYDAIIAKDASLRDCIRRAMICELSEPDPIKDPEKHKIEWSNGEKSYFTRLHEHHYSMTGKSCLGGTLEEATACIEEQVEECKKCKDQKFCPISEGYAYCTKKGHQQSIEPMSFITSRTKKDIFS